MIIDFIKPEPFIRLAYLDAHQTELDKLNAFVREHEGNVTHFREKFRSNPREYDVVIVNTLFEEKEHFYKKIYVSIENSGHLLIMPNLWFEGIELFLEEVGYVAINSTDKLTVAKKMHGWSSM